MSFSYDYKCLLNRNSKALWQEYIGFSLSSTLKATRTVLVGEL